MKIKLNSDDNLHLNKTPKFHNLTIVVRSVFQEEDGKCYPQVCCFIIIKTFNISNHLRRHYHYIQ